MTLEPLTDADFVEMDRQNEELRRIRAIAENWAQYDKDEPVVRLSTEAAGLLARDYLRQQEALVERMVRLGEISGPGSEGENG